MTEMLEPAPMLNDSDEYGGVTNSKQDINNNNYNSYNITNNDDAESDIELDIKDSDSDTDNINIHTHEKTIDAMTPKQNMNMSFDDDKKHQQEEHVSNDSDNSNTGLIYDKIDNPRISNKDHRATSAGLILGESNNEEIDRVNTLSEQINMNNNAKHINDKYRSGNKGCCSDCYSRLYSYPRLQILLSFLYLLVSLILCYADIFGALWIANEIWTFKYPNANTNYHELWFAILMVFIVAPYLISWAAHLIFIEEKLSRQNDKIIKVSNGTCFKLFVKYPIMILYLITPIGIVFLLIYEIFYIYLFAMLNLLFYRFLCRKPSYKMIMNIKKTKGSRAYLRFRKITHMLSSSIPLMIFYGYLYYFDPYPRLKWKYLAATAFVSGLNSLFTILSFLSDAHSINISFSQYFILSFRLFGGFIPKLSQIKNGEIKSINYSSFAFGNYSYAKFSDVIESEKSKLKTVILTRSTLSDLSVSLCYQLGAVCKSKNIQIIILKNYSPFFVWFKYLFPFKNGFKYKVKLSEIKQSFRTCDIFGDKAEEAFDLLEHDLDNLYGKNNDDKYYYYRDFVADWNGFDIEINNKKGLFHRLLRILPPHIIDINNKHTKENNGNRVRDERLLNLVLGLGTINEIDPINKTSALFYAIIQLDYDLINRLCDNGAAFNKSKDEWQKIGEYIIQLVKDNKYSTLKQLIQLISDRQEIECDLTYHDIDGKTAVIYSAINGNIEICELLLNANLGADILHMDSDGNTATDYAAKHKHTQLQHYLTNLFL